MTFGRRLNATSTSSERGGLRVKQALCILLVINLFVLVYRWKRLPSVSSVTSHGSKSTMRPSCLMKPF